MREQGGSGTTWTHHNIRCTLRVSGTRWRHPAGIAMKLTMWHLSAQWQQSSQKLRPPLRPRPLQQNALPKRENAQHPTPVSAQFVHLGMQAAADFLAGAHTHTSVLLVMGATRRPTARSVPFHLQGRSHQERQSDSRRDGVTGTLGTPVVNPGIVYRLELLAV